LNLSSLTAVIVAGGKGLRMGTSLPKQFLPLKELPVISYAIKAFLDCFPAIQIVLVVPKAHIPLAESCLELFRDTEQPIIIAEGGETRFHSVRNGLKAILQPGIVFVHDGVRPFVDMDLIKRCYKQALEKGSAIPALPVSDSIRCWNGSKYIAIDRTALRSLQTPQVFQTNLLLSAYQQNYQEGFTDEATVVEAMGGAIHLIEGSKNNIKITTPEDLLWAEYFLKQ